MAEEVVESKEWYISAYAPQGIPNSDHLKLRSMPLSLASDSVPEGHVAVEVLWISIDKFNVNLLKSELGYDDAFNYKIETDFNEALSKYFPNGIDLYLDNVGGKMLEAVLNHVNRGARISACGMISEYNKIWTEREGVRNLLNIVGKEVRMQGFMMSSYLNHYPDFVKEMEGYIVEGKIKSKHKIYNGIESLESFASIFSSANDGKVMLKVK